MNKGCVMTQMNKVKNAISMASAMMTVSTAQAMTGVSADEAQDLMKTVIDIIAKLVFVPAAIMAITGIIQYASAHSDGDGPGTKKAINMLAAGIMLAALGIILEATKDTFANIIKS